MNLRPSGYEPDELPDCSTPHQEGRAFYKRGAGPARIFPPHLRTAEACAAQAIAAAIFRASVAAASRSRLLAGQPMPNPSR